MSCEQFLCPYPDERSNEAIRLKFKMNLNIFEFMIQFGLITTDFKWREIYVGLMFFLSLI